MENFGGTEHDWINMLAMLHLPLGAAHGMAGMLSLAAFAVWGVGLVWGLHIAGLRPFRPSRKAGP